jgi:hypothetical protein
MRAPPYVDGAPMGMEPEGNKGMDALQRSRRVKPSPAYTASYAVNHRRAERFFFA